MFRRGRSLILEQMSGSGDTTKKSRSVALAAGKARSLRVQRLKMMLDQRIDNPFAALDALLAEAADGDPQAELWERLHAAAMRDGVEAALADAYLKAVESPRMRRVPAAGQADVLLHAADYFQGIRGDAETAERLLQRILSVMPDHVEAFGRLEKRLEKLADNRRLVELFATVAATPPRPLPVLATQAHNRLVMLTAKEPLSEDAAKRLLAYVPANPKLLDALDAHCRATKRPELACELIESALGDGATGPEADARAVQRRHRLIELYFGEANAPAKAIAHVEALLERDPRDAEAFKAGEHLLSVLEVSSRAAAAVQKARRARAGA